MNKKLEVAQSTINEYERELEKLSNENKIKEEEVKKFMQRSKDLEDKINSETGTNN